MRVVFAFVLTAAVIAATFTLDYRNGGNERISPFGWLLVFVEAVAGCLLIVSFIFPA